MGATISIPSGPYVVCKVNGILVQAQELHYFLVEFKEGASRAPLLRMVVVTSSPELQASLKSYGCIIELDYTQLDAAGRPGYLRRCRFKSFKSSPVEDSTGTDAPIAFRIIATIDSPKYWETAGIISSSMDMVVPHFLRAFPCFHGMGEPGSGTMKFRIHDGVDKRAGDGQKWLAHDSSPVQAMQAALEHSYIKMNPNGGREWVYLTVLNFNKDGYPTFNLYDLKLRCQEFEPRKILVGGVSVPAKFSWAAGNSEDRIPYTDSKVVDRGADYVSKFWKKKAATYVQDYSTMSYRTVVEPLLFKDSMPFKESSETPKGPVPINTAFTGAGATRKAQINTNNYGPEFSMQRLQYETTMGFWRKLDVRLSFERTFVPVDVGDIVDIELPITKEGSKVVDLSLSTKYMVSEVYEEYSSSQLSTYFSASRDSLSSKAQR